MISAGVLASPQNEESITLSLSQSLDMARRQRVKRQKLQVHCMLGFSAHPIQRKDIPFLQYDILSTNIKPLSSHLFIFVLTFAN